MHLATERPTIYFHIIGNKVKSKASRKNTVSYLLQVDYSLNSMLEELEDISLPCKNVKQQRGTQLPSHRISLSFGFQNEYHPR